MSLALQEYIGKGSRRTMQRALNTVTVCLALGLCALAGWQMQNPETFELMAVSFRLQSPANEAAMGIRRTCQLTQARALGRLQCQIAAWLNNPSEEVHYDLLFDVAVLECVAGLGFEGLDCFHRKLITSL